MDTRLSENLNNKQHDYIAPFLWLHGEDDELIIKEIHRIYESNIRSVCLESRTHEDFCRKEWWDDIKLIFDECRKLGMKVWILDDKHFPSGYANGIFADKYKDLRPFGITEFHIDVAGPCTDACAIADHNFGMEGDEIISVIACRHNPESDTYSGESIDITNGLCDGLVYFTLPDGMWRIFFIIKTRYGIHPTKLDFCDVLNPETIKLYIDEVYQPHYDHFKEYFGNTFLGFFSDEPGFRNNSITDEYSNNFCNQLADWCHEHGVMYIGHIIEISKL